MDNLIQLLEYGTETLPPPAQPSDIEADVEDDLARGRRALTRLRHRRLATRSGVLLAAAAVALGGIQLTAGHQAPGRPDARAATASSTAASAADPTTSSPVAQFKLVDYTGPQRPGFRVDRVPDGWSLLNSDDLALVIAPPGARSNMINRRPDFVDKVAVFLQSPDAEVHLDRARPVQLNGRAAEITGDVTTGRQVLFTDSPGHRVLVQVWAGIKLTDAQVVALARGVTVIGDPTAARG